MIIENNKKIESLDSTVIGDRFGDDMENDAYGDDINFAESKGKTFHMQQSGIVNVIDYETLVQENFARSMLEMRPDTTSKDKFDSKNEKENLMQELLGEEENDEEEISVKESNEINLASDKNKNPCEMWPIARDDDTVCKFTENAMIVGESFP